MVFTFTFILTPLQWPPLHNSNCHKNAYQLSKKPLDNDQFINNRWMVVYTKPNFCGKWPWNLSSAKPFWSLFVCWNDTGFDIFWSCYILICICYISIFLRQKCYTPWKMTGIILHSYLPITTTSPQQPLPPQGGRLIEVWLQLVMTSNKEKLYDP